MSAASPRARAEKGHERIEREMNERARAIGDRLREQGLLPKVDRTVRVRFVDPASLRAAATTVAASAKPRHPMSASRPPGAPSPPSKPAKPVPAGPSPDRGSPQRACQYQPCGKPFTPAHPRQSYCTVTHRDAARRERAGVPSLGVKVPCGHCNTPFLRASGRQRYCSETCTTLGRRAAAAARKRERNVGGTSAPTTPPRDEVSAPTVPHGPPAQSVTGAAPNPSPGYTPAARQAYRELLTEQLATEPTSEPLLRRLARLARQDPEALDLLEQLALA